VFSELVLGPPIKQSIQCHSLLCVREVVHRLAVIEAEGGFTSIEAAIYTICTPYYNPLLDAPAIVSNLRCGRSVIQRG
jgi:hypothetical protein